MTDALQRNGHWQEALTDPGRRAAAGGKRGTLVFTFPPSYSTFNSLIAQGWIGDKQNFVIIAAGASMTIAWKTFPQNGPNGRQANAIRCKQHQGRQFPSWRKPYWNWTCPIWTECLLPISRMNPTWDSTSCIHGFQVGDEKVPLRHLGAQPHSTFNMNCNREVAAAWCDRVVVVCLEGSLEAVDRLGWTGSRVAHQAEARTLVQPPGGCL